MGHFVFASSSGIIHHHHRHHSRCSCMIWRPLGGGGWDNSKQRVFRHKARGSFFFWFSFFLTSHAPAGWLPTLLYLRYLRLRKRKKKKTHNREREREGGQYRSRVVQSRLPFPTSLPVLPSSPAAAAAALRTTRSDDEIWAGQSKHSHADWPRRSNLPCGRYAYFPQRSRSLFFFFFFFFFFFCGRGAAVSALRTALRVRQSRIRTRNPPPPPRRCADWLPCDAARRQSARTVRCGGGAVTPST